jgi:P4 family phage/plasmid primase-like protien
MFNDFIKIGCKVERDESNKKIITGLPKEWLYSNTSLYNNDENFMIICGKVNNITVIDLDFPKNNESDSIKWFIERFGELSEINTLVTKTINNGFHVYFSYNDALKTTTKFNGIPLDILNDKKGVLEGKGYEIINDSDIRELTDSELLHFLLPDKTNTQSADNVSACVSLNYSKEFIIRILDGLCLSRFDNDDSWLRLGFFLSQFEFGKELFDFYSMTSEKFNQDNNDMRWNSFDNTSCNKPTTIGTLIFWLKNDNPNLFSIINKEYQIISEINNITKHENITANEVLCIDKTSIDLLCDYEKALIPLHNVSSKRCNNCVLQGLVSANGFVLKCKNCDFCYPQSPIEIEKTKSPTVYNIINQVNVYEDIKNKDTQQAAEIILSHWNNRIVYVEKNWFVFNNENGLYNEIDPKLLILEIEKTVTELKKTCSDAWLDWTCKIDYKKKLIEELLPRCYLSNIEFNDNPNLLGFPNGVLDLQSFEFRKGYKSDYITMKCKYPYDDTINTDLAKEFLRDYFNNDTDLAYVIDLLSLCLEGRNRTQQFVICYGFSASNGKSFLMERLSNIFNHYANTFPVNMITSKMREAGNANVDLVNFKYKRFMYCSEPESNSKFNINLLKQLTGDTITARKNYSNEIEKIKPTYNLFILCNRLPEMDGYDEGVNRRINIIEFKNKFVDNPNKKNKSERLRKKYSEDELITIEKNLLHLLLKNYKDLQIRKFELIQPEYLALLKESYGKSNSILQEILDEYIVHSDNETDTVSRKEIKNILKENKIKKINDIDLVRIIEGLYNCNYHDEKYIKGHRYRCQFLNLKFTNV